MNQSSKHRRMFPVLLLNALLMGQIEAKKSFTFSKPTTTIITMMSTGIKNRKNATHHNHIGTNIVGGFTAVHPNHNNNYHLYRRPTNIHNDNNVRGHILRGILRSDRDDGSPAAGTGMEHSFKHRTRNVPNTDPYSLYKHHHHHLHHPVLGQQQHQLEVEHHGDKMDTNINMKPNYMSIGGGGVRSSSPRRRRLIRRSRNGKLTLSSTISADYTHPQSSIPLKDYMAQQVSTLRKRTQSTVTNIDVQDCAVFLSYICSMVAITLPVILIPMIAADPYKATSTASTAATVGRLSGTDLAAKIVSTSALGAALGKVINGFICQSLGSRKSAGTYFVGLAYFSLLLSTTSTFHARAVAGMEFCCSIMWVACNVLIANKYARDAQKFAQAITVLSLCSTGGSLSIKVVGSALLGAYHWRKVALVSTLASSIGAFLMFFVVKDGESVNKKSSEISTSGVNGIRWRRGLSTIWPIGGASREERNAGLSLQSITSSITRVLSSKMFWFVALAHSCSFLGRSSDKILGTFLFDITKIPRHICASLTTSVTVGFIVGLITGRKIESMEEVDKKRFIMKRQIGAIFSALSIAVLANQTVISMLGRKVVAAAITLASCLMTANLSIQFYQFPAKFAKSFEDDKAVCMAFTDAVAFFLSCPIWAIVSTIATSTRFGSNGWSIAWIFVSALFAVGGGISLKTMKETM